MINLNTFFEANETHELYFKYKNKQYRISRDYFYPSTFHLDLQTNHGKFIRYGLLADLNDIFRFLL